MHSLKSISFNFFLYVYMQVLHMDRNDYYGGESTSLNLTKV
jgi:RAB protein geranylgeranyltransferase component A